MQVNRRVSPNFLHSLSPNFDKSADFQISHSLTSSFKIA